MSNDPLNVIFIMTDQQRADSYGPGRHPCADYPTLEKLAGESVCFSNFFTSSSPCVPSRHSYLTGRQLWMLGCCGNGKFAKPDETTWMSILREQGYRCVSVGKTHMIHSGSFHIQVPTSRSFADQRGWDHFHPEASPEDDYNYFDIQTVRRACEALDILKSEGPFALFLGFHAPHEPYVMPGKYLDFCKPEDVTLPESCGAEEYHSKSIRFRKRIDFLNEKFGTITDDDIKKGIAGHHCLMKMVDDCLGDFLDYLGKEGLLEKSLIVYCSDHGDMLGDHRLFNKSATFYDEETRVPMMIRFPDGRHAGVRREKLASSIDFVPTLFDMLGIDPDLSLPGVSLMPMIEQDETLREHVTSATPQGMMFRTATHKLWRMGGDGEMYDLADDPREMKNLYNDPDYRDLRAELTERMLESRMRDDALNNRLTRAENGLRFEVKSSREPET